MSPRFAYFFAAVASIFASLAACDAQVVAERISRLDTKEAALLQSATEEVRKGLESDTFRELKQSLPQAKIGKTLYYFVEGDRRLTEEQLLIHAAELDHQYATWRSLKSFPEAVWPGIAGREQGLVSEAEQGKAVRWIPGSTLRYCVMRGSFGAARAGLAGYNDVRRDFQQAIESWMSIQETTLPRFEYRSDLDNSPLTETPADVTFAVWAFNLPGTVIASAFFPNEPQNNWHVLVDPESYFGADLAFDRVGVLRHELGHVLGFRHEHPRSEAPLVCQTLEVFDEDVIPLGDYDPLSVMHYFCRGFGNPAQEALNVERRKLRITPTDIQGVRLIYPAQGASSGLEYFDCDPSRSRVQLTGPVATDDAPSQQPATAPAYNQSAQSLEQAPTAAPCCGGAPPSASRLSQLEAAAANRSAAPTAELSAKDQAEVVAAAAQFAARMAGDDNALFTRLAISSRMGATAAKQGQNLAAMMADFAGVAGLEGALSDSGTAIWETPSLQANFRNLMMQAAESDSGLAPITGPPLAARVVGPGTQEVGATMFRDCVAVGARVGGQDRYCCTGTLIAPTVVVTAGHCFFCVGGGAASSAVVYVGQNISGGGQAFRGKAFRHPQYNQGGLQNDLTVIVLDAPVTGVTPRRIATLEETNSKTFVRVVGFGNSDFGSSGGFGVKRMVDVPIASHACTGEGDEPSLGCDANLELVAGFVGLGSDSCNGDSGGPIYVLVGDDARNDDAWAVCGATSRATTSATRPCGDGGIYVRFDQYLEFIEEVSGVDF